MSGNFQVDLSECSVLIVDDATVNVKILESVLGKESLTTFVANDGPSALSIAAEFQPDLILLDIQMPGMDGFEVCQHLKKESSTRNIPIIFITSMTGQEHIKAGFDAGAVDYICKPIKKVEVLARISSHLGINQMIQRQSYLIGNLESALEENSQSVTRTSHELRTPLNAILGFSQIIRRWAVRNNEQQIQEHSNIILSAGDHLLKLISNMLDLAKADAGRMLLNPEQFEMLPLVNLVKTLVQPLVATNNNTMVFNAGIQISVFGDETRIRQVLLNLISNACKFTQDGTITVSTHYTHDTCTITVEDTGIGIDKDQQKAIFHPYTQADKSTYSQFGGTGLGLAISYRLVKLMHGTLNVVSEPGQGCVFSFSFPILAMEPVDDSFQADSSKV